MRKSKKTHDKLFVMAEKFLASTSLKYAYINFFEKATLEEFKMVDIKEKDNILHAGCGSLPNTLISLGKNFKANYFGIDIDPEAVEIAKKVVNEYKLDNVIIEEGDAFTYPLKKFDVIIVSFGLNAKKEFFERLKNETKNDVKIIYRKQWDFLDFIYGRKDEIPDGFRIMAYHKRRDFIKSYLLEKVKSEK
ncbi:MAG TPA: class I SAM-dependent methyltransferase [Thermoplasmatales archaeon]|nr:class I SAM-dependent methyltransferase [Thermoplasmatales archaeon]